MLYNSLLAELLLMKHLLTSSVNETSSDYSDAVNSKLAEA